MRDTAALALAFLAALGTAIAIAMALALPANADISDNRANELKHMVIQDCGSCHGLRLKGGLGTDLTAKALEGAAPDTLASIILDGVPGTAMPRWRPLLTPEEALWIVDFLQKGLK